MRTNAMRRASTRGFTLIELLAAMALGTLLMLAMMGVLRSLRVPSSPADSAIPPDVLRLLRWDLVNARRFESQPDGVRLLGLDSLDPVDMQPTHRPATVIYRISTFAGKSALMRTEQPLGNAANRTTFSQLVCPDITEFYITPLPDPTSAGGDSEPFGRNSGNPLPRCVEIQLTRDAGAPVQTTICRR
jgi:prepilin-type N-terminal cleavage/methylation domain-containing protein